MHELAKGYTRIVYQYVQLPVTVDGLRYRRVPIGLIGDVQMDIFRATTSLVNFRLHFRAFFIQYVA